MLKIIGSIIMSGIGIIMIAASQNTSTYSDNANYKFIALGAVLQIAAFFVMLYGLRDFFRIRDIMDELNIIKQRIPHPTTQPVVIDPKHLCFEPDPPRKADTGDAAHPIALG